jgi:hypothetical protein
MDKKQGSIILFHNINGMKETKKWYQILATMRELNADIFGFAKVNRSLNRGYSNKWTTLIKKVFYYSRNINSECNIQLETPYKPGGTITTITGKWQSRVTKMGQDKKRLKSLELHPDHQQKCFANHTDSIPTSGKPRSKHSLDATLGDALRKRSTQAGPNQNIL